MRYNVWIDRYRGIISYDRISWYVSHFNVQVLKKPSKFILETKKNCLIGEKSHFILFLRASRNIRYFQCKFHSPRPVECKHRTEKYLSERLATPTQPPAKINHFTTMARFYPAWNIWSGDSMHIKLCNIWQSSCNIHIFATYFGLPLLYVK